MDGEMDDEKLDRVDIGLMYFITFTSYFTLLFYFLPLYFPPRTM